MRSQEGCQRVFALVLGLGVLIVFGMPAAALALFTGSIVVFLVACVIVVTGLLLIDYAIRG